MNWCITHNCLTEFPVGRIQDCIIVSVRPSEEFDKDGWEWTLSLPEPSPEELAIMNASAIELEAQFVGE